MIFFFFLLAGLYLVNPTARRSIGMLGTADTEAKPAVLRQASYFGGSKMWLSQRGVVFTRARRASLHIPAPASLRDALGRGKKISLVS